MGASDSATSSLEVRVLGTFRFWAEGSALPAVLGGSQRLLALLGLRDRALMRASVAGILWPESTEEHAYSSLRSALGRLSRITRDAVVVTPLDLCLADGVTVDIRESRALAHRLLDRGAALARGGPQCGGDRRTLPRRSARLVRRLGAGRSRRVASASTPRARRARRPTADRRALRRSDGCRARGRCEQSHCEKARARW